MLWNINKARSRPRVHEPILARSQKAVLAEDERRQPFVRNLFTDQRL